MTAYKQTLVFDEPRDADERTGDRISGIVPTARRMREQTSPDRVKAKDLMSLAPAVLHMSSTIRTAVEVLQSLDMRYLPIIDDDGRLVGTLSDRELRAVRIPYFVGNEYIGNLQGALDRTVDRLLGHAVVSVDVDDSVTEALACMLHHKIAFISVTNEDGVLVGVLDYKDLLRVLPFDVEAPVSAA